MSQYIVKVDVTDSNNPIYYGPYDFDKAFEVVADKSEFFCTEIILLVP